MATTTTNLSLSKPAVNSATDEDQWGDQLNTNMDTLDSEAATKTVALNFADFELSRPKLKDYGETLFSHGTTNGAVTFDFTNGNHQDITMDGTVTATFSNPPASGVVGVLVLYLKQDGTGSRTVTWPGSVVWAGGSAPTLTTTANKTDELIFITRDGGTTYTGSVRGLNFTV